MELAVSKWPWEQTDSVWMKQGLEKARADWEICTSVAHVFRPSYQDVQNYISDSMDDWSVLRKSCIVRLVYSLQPCLSIIFFIIILLFLFKMDDFQINSKEKIKRSFIIYSRICCSLSHMTLSLSMLVSTKSLNKKEIQIHFLMMSCLVWTCCWQSIPKWDLIKTFLISFGCL